MKPLLAFVALVFCLAASAAEVIPPLPANHFNDYAHVVSAATASQLDQQLTDFERQSSSQILVAIYPTMESDSAIEDYTVRVYRAWKVGLKGKDNGAVLFVFTKEHRMRIATGYGLEGALPDVICKRILDGEITPRLRAGDFNGAMSAGVAAMIAAAKGEYKGTGRSVADQNRNGSNTFGAQLVLILVIFFVAMFILSALIKGGRNLRGGGWSYGAGGFGGWSGGGGGSGGGWSGGGGGGDSGSFSSGGGSTGGGGASGSW